MEDKYIYMGVTLVVLLLVIYRGITDFKSKDLIIKLAVIRAEEIFKSGEGKEKMLYAMQQVRLGLPTWVRWLLSDTVLKSLIELALGEFQPAFKGQAAIVGGGEVGYRVNKIFEEKRGELYAEATTNLKGDSRISAGVKYKI